MWSGSCSAEPTARSLLAGPAEDLTPWWELDSRLAEFQRARPRRTTSAVASRCVGSRCVDGRWVLEGPAPAWFRGAQDLLQGTPLAPIDAFEVTRMLAAGDADDLEQLLRVEVHPDPAARHDACGAWHGGFAVVDAAPQLIYIQYHIRWQLKPTPLQSQLSRATVWGNNFWLERVLAVLPYDTVVL